MTDNDGYCKSCEKLADEIERLRETGLRLFQYVDIHDVEVCDMDAWELWYALEELHSREVLGE